MMLRYDDVLRRLEALASRFEMMKIDAYLRYAQNWKRRLTFDFVGGIARGVGFSIGFTLISALILILLKNAAMANLPGIGRYLAELMQIVETNLMGQ